MTQTPADQAADTVDEPRANPTETEEEHLLLDALDDRLESLRLLSADSEERAALLEQFGVRGKAEEDIARQLSLRKPLWRPDRFDQAHRMMMRGLEVLDRNGTRPPKLRNLSVLTPIAAFVVSQLTRWIIKSYQNNFVNRLRKLYGLRAANSVWGSPEHVMLRRAHRQVEGIHDYLQGRALGLPTFLLGGAFLTTISSALLAVIRAAFGNWIIAAILTIVALGVFLGFGWCALTSAAIARRRIRLSTEVPAKALYETIGACGDPPTDQSVQLAYISIALMALAWIIVPVGIAIAVTAG